MNKQEEQPSCDKQGEPVAWNENVDAMPLNTYCKAIVDWRSYFVGGGSREEGEDVEVIVVKYGTEEDQIVFIHEGSNQYLHTSCDISKWRPLYTRQQPNREPLTDEQIEVICTGLWSGGWRQKAMADFARAIEAAHGIKE